MNTSLKDKVNFGSSDPSSGDGRFIPPIRAGGAPEDPEDRVITLKPRRAEKLIQETSEVSWLVERILPTAGSLVLVGDVRGTVHAVDAFTGDGLWVFNTDGRITSTPVYAHGILYITSWDGTLYAIK